MSLSEAVQRVEQADAALAEAAPTPFPVPLGGLASIVAGSITALDRGDWWVPGLRERVGGVLRDAPVERFVDGLAGARPYKIAPPTPSPALRALHAVGLAVGSGRTTLVHLGIGSAADGAFHEALNLAALQDAPVLFVVAVQTLTDDAPVGRQLAGSPADLAAALGLDVAVVDGRDVEAVHGAVRAAKATGRPTLIEARLNKD